MTIASPFSYARFAMNHAPVAAAFLCCILPAAHAKPANAPALAYANDSITYIVRPGDNLYRLAEQYLLHTGDYRIVAQINHVSRARAIPPGTRLTIPTRLLRAEQLEAKLLAFRGDCRIEQSTKQAELTPGLAVSPGAVLQTGPGGFMALELSNGSRITIPSQSRLRITAMRRFLLTKAVDFDFTVEQGRIETQATHLPDGRGRYRIRTPIAVSAVRGTTFRVGYDGKDAPSLTEVIDGTVAVAPGIAPTAAVPIPKGFGAGVSASGKLDKEALLPAPVPVKPGRVQTDMQVRLVLDPVPGARAYHIQIARDAGFVVMEAEATAAVPELTFDSIANGQWFVRATAVAQSGLEGMPTTYTMRRALTGLSAEAGADSNGGWRFKWAGAGSGKRIYHFQLRPDVPASVPMVDETGLTGDTVVLSKLLPGKYLWRVGVRQYDAGVESESWLPESGLLVADPTQ